MGADGVLPDRDPPVRAETAARERTHAGDSAVPAGAHGHPQGAAGAGRASAGCGTSWRCCERLRGVDGGRAAGGGAAVPGLDRAGGRRRHEPGRAGEAAGGRRADRAGGGVGPGGGGDAPPGGDAPRHQPGEHRGLRRRCARAWWTSRWRRRWPRSGPEFTHHTRDRGDAGVSGAGADRAHRPVGGPARRPVRAGRDAVRAGHGCAAVRFRRPAAAHPRSSGAGAGAAGAR